MCTRYSCAVSRVVLPVCLVAAFFVEPLRAQSETTSSGEELIPCPYGLSRFDYNPLGIPKSFEGRTYWFLSEWRKDDFFDFGSTARYRAYPSRNIADESNRLAWLDAGITLRCSRVWRVGPNAGQSRTTASGSWKRREGWSRWRSAVGPGAERPL